MLFRSQPIGEPSFCLQINAGYDFTGAFLGDFARAKIAETRHHHLCGNLAHQRPNLFAQSHRAQAARLASDAAGISRRCCIIAMRGASSCAMAE